MLKREYAQAKQISPDDPDRLDMEGTVISGLGEGQYYINLPGYRDQFEEAVQMVPFPGTLNLRLTRESMPLRERLNEMPAIHIRSFSDDMRRYGGGRCHPVTIGDIRAAIVIPDRSHYPEDLIELIAPINLREALALKDGDLLTIRVMPPPADSS
ncbi:MAG: DUF120 domain-containing protein [Methanotrichaceae archaeon]|nr:DUF120 domain-containing protein [Methanotrichaceae archaeon]